MAAARVGGIFANNTYRAEFSYTNLAIQTNIIHAAWQAGVKGIVVLFQHLRISAHVSAADEGRASFQRRARTDQ